MSDATLTSPETPPAAPPAVAAAAAARVPRSRPRVGHVLLPASIVLVFLVGWQIVADAGVFPEYALPSPLTVLDTGFTDSGTFLSAAGVTGTEMIIGYVLAVLVGYGLAVLMVHMPRVEQGLYPLLVATQCVPILAIAPLLIMWFGFGLPPKIVPVFLFCFFPIVLTSVAGLKSVERDMLLLMRSLGAGRWQTFRRVLWPAALPSVFTGLKQAAVYSAIGAVTAEWVGSENGLGQIMISGTSFLQTDTVFAAIFYLTAMAFVLFAAVNALERVMLRWYFLTKR